MQIFVPSASPADIRHYHRVVSQSVQVRTHFDMLIWLQGEMQHYLPHDIMIAAWGNFQAGDVRHDVISPMTGVRSNHANTEVLTPLLLDLYQRWTGFNKVPYAIKVGENGFLMDAGSFAYELRDGLKAMRCAMVHGISDERHGVECLYVTFTTKPEYSTQDRANLGVVIPYIDSALRQVSHLPEQTPTLDMVDAVPQQASVKPEHNLSSREAEIMFWVALGKTTPEIGCILNISEFTVKNHMQRVFKKLDVTNRAQAVGKFRELCD